MQYRWEYLKKIEMKMDNSKKQRPYLNLDGPVCTRPWTYPDIRLQWLPAPSWSQQKWFELQLSDPFIIPSPYSTRYIFPFYSATKNQLYKEFKDYLHCHHCLVL